MLGILRRGSFACSGALRDGAMAGRAEGETDGETWGGDDSLCGAHWDVEAVPAAFGLSLSSKGDSTSDWEDEGDWFIPFADSDAGSEPDRPPDLVAEPQWDSMMMADRSGSESSLFTDIHSQIASDHSSETELSELADETFEELGYSAHVFLPPKNASEPPSISARATQRLEDIPWPGPMPLRCQGSNKTSQAGAAVQESAAPRIPPAPSAPPTLKAERGSADAAEPACPLCNRTCEEPHRLGVYWRKFGYKGTFCC